MPDITRIVCPVDFSEPSQHAIEHAVALARWYDAPIVAVHVQIAQRAPVPAFELVGAGGAAYDEPPELTLLRNAAADFVAASAPSSVPVRAVVAMGSPAAEIVGQGEAEPGTVIVMG